MPRGGEALVRMVADALDHPRAQARQGAVARLRGRQGRRGDGDRDRRERQGPAPVRLQRDGDPPRRPGGRRPRPCPGPRPARDAGVELRGCPRTLGLVPWAKPATEEAGRTKYLDLILAVRVVDDFEPAVTHIREYGSGLAEAIVTRDYARARRFLAEVDAACVLVNASTRLCDGSQFGIGSRARHLHLQAPRPRSGPGRGADHDEVRGPRLRAAPGVVEPSPTGRMAESPSRRPRRHLQSHSSRAPRAAESFRERLALDPAVPASSPPRRRPTRPPSASRPPTIATPWPRGGERDPGVRGLRRRGAAQRAVLTRGHARSPGRGVAGGPPRSSSWAATRSSTCPRGGRRSG